MRLTFHMRLLFAFCLLMAARAQSPDEADLIEQANRLRTDPQAFAKRLERRLRYYQGDLLRLPGKTPLRTDEGASAVREAISVLRKTKPMGDLKASKALHNAARDHARDIGSKGLMSHTGSDGSSMRERIGRYARVRGKSGEVISFGPSEAGEVIEELIIDDGVQSRGHRKLLLDPQFHFAGADCEQHKRFEVVCVVDLAEGLR